MSKTSQKSEQSLVTSITANGRKFTDYDIPEFGTVRFQTLMRGELSKIRGFPPALQYDAAILSVWVDEHNDQIHVVDDENCAKLEGLHSKSYDAMVDIINATVLNQASVESMVKNSNGTGNA